jgi:hypothetical protein
MTLVGLPIVAQLVGLLASSALEPQPSWSILPSGETARAIRPCSRPSPPGLRGSWIPQAADVTAAEVHLEAATADAIKSLRRDLRPTDALAYYRQYVGAFVGDKRVLYVTGLSKAMVDRRPRVFRWRSKAFDGCDLGSQVFGAVFEMGARRFISFDFDY